MDPLEKLEREVEFYDRYAEKLREQIDAAQKELARIARIKQQKIAELARLKQIRTAKAKGVTAV
ncbi:hypothetical protein [Thermococcus sp. ES12]|uniref:hypothetical protein n=1 Tax=Thermococcus sp. ES12 TaxID=1638246 RepID=UPI00143008FB|nr:hypothetical protein [Thermococcus sp. ES12]NJE75980.1 hypothetical protein [Thermococcus sp. ES12]